jgi:hypothetical protein
MKTDNALKKTLLRKSDELPYGFEDRVMRRIQLEVERKGRLSYYRALGLVSFVSLVLIAGVIFVLFTYFHFNFLDLFANLQMPSVAPNSLLTDQTRPIFAFSIYIGVLMLFLLGMDYFFRQRIRKSKKNL